MNKKIALVIASRGYQPIEYGVPKRVLEDANFEIVTVSDSLGKAISKDETISTEVDILISDKKVFECDGLYVIGGSGALDFLDNDTSYTLLQLWKKTGKPYGAICISPRILAHAQVLEGKKATGWDNDGNLDSIFKQYGVEYVRKDVVVDGTVITARGPSVAEEFGKEIVKLFS